MKLFSVLLVAGTATTVSAYCCSSPARCADGSESSIWECCAYGSCNIFCCNCDGGCITASTKRSWTDWGHGRPPFPGAFDAEEVCGLTVTDEQCVIDKLDALDGNLDGKVSLAEILANPDVVRPGVTKMDMDASDVKVKLTELFNIYDTNKDGYLDLDEASARQIVKIST
ncbi:hypothetical protein RBB50_012530 [Rhinocladiella similis]